MPPKPELTHRQRVKLALERRDTDRVPIALICSGVNEPARTLLDHHLRATRGVSLDQFLKPLIDVADVYAGPRAASPDGRDAWGVRRARIPTPQGGFYEEIDHYPLAAARDLRDLLNHPWPRVEDYDYAAAAARIRALRRDGDYCLMAANGNIFETSWYMRGFENLMVDFLEEPEFAHTLLAKVCDRMMEYLKRLLEAAPGEIDLVFTADDIAGQEDLLLSLPLWREFIQPFHRRMNRMLHEYGVKVVYHSDGAVMKAVPGLVDMGIDLLQALQFDARGMDPGVLKTDFGDRLGFVGGVSVQKTLPFGTPEMVAAEVRERKRVLGAGGNYILGPSHMIQAGTPPENIVALFDTAAEPDPVPAA